MCGRVDVARLALECQPDQRAHCAPNMPPHCPHFCGLGWESGRGDHRSSLSGPARMAEPRAGPPTNPARGSQPDPADNPRPAQQRRSSGAGGRACALTTPRRGPRSTCERRCRATAPGQRHRRAGAAHRVRRGTQGQDEGLGGARTLAAARRAHGWRRAHARRARRCRSRWQALHTPARRGGRRPAEARMHQRRHGRGRAYGEHHGPRRGPPAGRRGRPSTHRWGPSG